MWRCNKVTIKFKTIKLSQAGDFVTLKWFFVKYLIPLKKSILNVFDLFVCNCKSGPLKLINNAKRSFTFSNFRKGIRKMQSRIATVLLM